MLSRLKPILDVASSVVVIIGAVAVTWRMYQPAAERAGHPAPVEAVSGLSIPADQARHVRGNGRVVLVEFADYECPFCAKHAETTAPMISEELVDSGRIQHLVFNFSLPHHPRAQKAVLEGSAGSHKKTFR